MLTVEQLRTIRSSMTWGDQAYGKEHSDGDNAAMITHAMHRAAKRIGLAAPDSKLEAFLDDVLMDDLNTALEDERVPTSAATET